MFIDAWAGVARIEQALRILPCKGYIGTPKAHILRLFSKEIRKIPVKMIAGQIKYDKMRSNYPPEEVQSEDYALVTFTTGSTGSPKAANRTHKFLLSQHRALKKHIIPKPGEIELITLPIFILNSIANGTTAVIPPMNPAQPQNQAVCLRQSQYWFP